jgi:hypothetical protein
MGDRGREQPAHVLHHKKARSCFSYDADKVLKQVATRITKGLPQASRAENLTTGSTRDQEWITGL